MMTKCGGRGVGGGAAAQTPHRGAAHGSLRAERVRTHTHDDADTEAAGLEQRIHESVEGVP